MRKEIYRMEREEAVQLLGRARVVRVASTGEDGAPILRTVHAVVFGDHVAFHGAAAGEKTECIGREAVLEADEIVASIPSYFVDPARACPATTLYRSVQVHGALELVSDPERKARVMTALMEKFQPEGGYTAIRADDPLYAKMLRSLLVVQVPLARVDGKAKLGQNRTSEEVARIAAALWRRGAPGDPRAIELVRGANPTMSTPDFLRGPAGTTLSCALSEADVPGAVDLLRGEYWLASVPEARIGEAHLKSAAWVGARDDDGRVIATARATSDGRTAWIYDVCVAAEWRGRGLGKAVVRLLLDHPAVRGALVVFLSTRDADGLYARLGFRDVQAAPLRAYRVITMALRRDAASEGQAPVGGGDAREAAEEQRQERTAARPA
jgi:nitroimidazol reductase NimA-like FMN-containing flavoprotein (pyridoxamine 5'-phosphate oxidase superfamily)/ribosomal protein S18 acetylase RimI-like enzyme